MLHELRKRGAHTTRSLSKATGSMAVGTDVSELRQSGFEIACRYAGKTAEGRKVYEYGLLAEP